jgi:hypothetical protein
MRSIPSITGIKDQQLYNILDAMKQNIENMPTGTVNKTVNQITQNIGDSTPPGCIRPEKFGAIPDGNTDCTSAINTAIDTKLHVLLSDGVYMTSGAHTTRTVGQKIFGMGKSTPDMTSGTILRKLTGITSPSSDPQYIMLTLTGEDNSVSGLTIDNNNFSGAGLVISAGYKKADASDILIMNTGGTSYAMRFAPTSTYTCCGAVFHNLSFYNNYANLQINGVYHSIFYNTWFGRTSSNWALMIYAPVNGCEDVRFYNTYTEDKIDFTTTGVRDIYFFGGYGLVKYGSTSPIIKGNNTVAGGGSECAGVVFRDWVIDKQVSDSVNPLIQVNAYQSTYNNIRIRDAVSSSGWKVFECLGTRDLTLDTITVESTNPWNLFKTDDASAWIANCRARNINYTQGVTGDAKWVGEHISVKHSNINHSSKSTPGFPQRYFSFENIEGSLDLSHLTAPVIANFITGTITDPNETIAVGTKAGATQGVFIGSHSGATPPLLDIGGCGIWEDAGTGKVYFIRRDSTSTKMVEMT